MEHLLVIFTETFLLFRNFYVFISSFSNIAVTFELFGLRKCDAGFEGKFRIFEKKIFDLNF